MISNQPNQPTPRRDYPLGDPHLSYIYTQYKKRPTLLEEARLSWATERRDQGTSAGGNLKRFIERLLPPSVIS